MSILDQVMEGLRCSRFVTWTMTDGNHVSPLSLEPISLEPISLEPTSLEPTSLEPILLEPILLEPISVEPTSLETISHYINEFSSEMEQSL